MIRLSANLTMLFPEFDLLERVKIAARCGFHGMEVAFPYDGEHQRLAEALQEHHAEMVLINAPPGNDGERGLAALPGRQIEFQDSIGRAFQVASVLGCRQIHVMSGIAAPGSRPQGNLDTLVENLRWAAPRAQDNGFRILLEPINRRSIPGYILHTPELALEIIHQVGHPSVALQFDFFHAQIAGGDLLKRFEAALPTIGHVQIAGVPDRHEPSESEVNFDYILQRIDELGYAGWVGCEYIPRRTTLEGLSWAGAYGVRAPGPGVS